MSGRYKRQFRPEFSRLDQDRDLSWIIPFELDPSFALIGPRFGGKSTVASYLAERQGCRLVSIGSILRDLATEAGQPIRSREELQCFGDQIRTEQDDPAYLARLALRRVRQIEGLRRPRGFKRGRVVLTGIKHLDEVELIAGIEQFNLIDVYAGVERRLERAMQTGILQAAHAAEQAGLEEEGKETTLFTELDSGEQLAAFQRLVEEPEAAGFDPRHRWDEKYVAAYAPIQAYIETGSVRRLDNDLAGLPEMQSSCDRLVREVLTPVGLEEPAGGV